MTLRDLTATLTLYRSGTLTLEEAAKRSETSIPKLTSELRVRAIPVRESPADTIERERV